MTPTDGLGRQTQPATKGSVVETIAYAPSGPKRRFGPVLRWTAVGLAATVAILFVDFNCDYGTVIEACKKCGAARHGRYFSLFHSYHPYGWTMKPNVVSRLIEADQKYPCAHDWVTASCNHRWIRATYLGLFPWSNVNALDRGPQSTDLLRMKCQADPAFVRKLKDAVSPLNHNSNFWNTLMQEYWEWVDKNLPELP